MKIKSQVLLVAVLIPLSLPFYSHGDTSEKYKIGKLIDLYFSSWSEQNMEAYRNCFHPDAVVQFVGGNSVITTYNLSSFIEEQTAIQRYSTIKMKEVPLSKSIYVEGGNAHVIVKWKLFKDTFAETGYDHFVLLRVKNEWKIIYLTFHKI
jgi:hypothetical protein